MDSFQRFGITDRRPHLAGGLYVTFNKLHRRVRLLDYNIHLVMVLSGEPSLEDLNNVFEPFKCKLKLLYIGTVPLRLSLHRVWIIFIIRHSSHRECCCILGVGVLCGFLLPIASFQFLTSDSESRRLDTDEKYLQKRPLNS